MNIFKRLMNLFWHDTSGGDLDEPLRSVVAGDASAVALPPEPPAPVIGEPVLSIIEATKDVSRWEKVFEQEIFKCLHLRDTVTGVEYKIYRPKVPPESYYLSGFSWMTEDERKAVRNALWRLSSAILKAEGDAEKNKMMALYCKGEES